jgi:hypothetical protein
MCSSGFASAGYWAVWEGRSSWTISAYRDENNFGIAHGGLDIRAEEEVLAAHLLHHIIKPWLVDGQTVAIPCINSLFRTYI